MYCISNSTLRLPQKMPMELNAINGHADFSWPRRAMVLPRYVPSHRAIRPPDRGLAGLGMPRPGLPLCVLAPIMIPEG